MFTVSLSHHGNSTDLQSFATLEEARAFAKKERTQNEGHPDFRKAEWAISDDEGACWPTEPAANLPLSVAYSHSLSDALVEGGCEKGKGKDFTVIQIGGGYGDCLIIHSQKAFGIWESLPKNHPDKCAVGY